jgi:hypothetical protein
MTTMNLFDMTDTWNAGATTFTAIKMSVTDTASAAGSLLMDLQVGGVSRFSVSKLAPGRSIAFDASAQLLVSGTTGGGLRWDGNNGFDIGVTAGRIQIADSWPIEWRSGSAMSAATDLVIRRDAADILAQRRGTGLVPQTFRIYNVYDTVSDYERGVFDWTSTANSLTIGTAQGGTGSARSVRIVTQGDANILLATNGTTRLNVSSGGSIFSTNVTFSTDNTYDIGASGANRPRNLYVAGRSVINTLTIGLGGQTAVATNTALGFEALNSASLTGTNNTGLGYWALRDNTTGSNNSAVGHNALYANTTGSTNNAVGVNALTSNTTGGNNSAIGHSVLFRNTTGGSNTAVGMQTLFENTTGSFSTAVGREALHRFVSNQNTAFGYRALYGGDATPANNTGTNNIAIGFQAGDAITTGSTNIVIGHDIDVDSATGSNQINIGDRYYHNRMRLVETTDPAAPAADNAIIFVRDNGSGKTQLCVRFPTGAVQVISTEP